MGRPTVRPRLSSVLGLACLGLCALLVAFLIGLAHDLLTLRQQVARLRVDAAATEQTLGAVPIDPARVDRQVRALQGDTARLSDGTHSLTWRVGSTIPFLGGSLRTGTSVAVVADDVSRHALPVLADLVVDLRTGTRSGPLDVTPVSRRRVSLEAARVRLSADERLLARQDLSDPAVHKGFVVVADRLQQLKGALATLITVARIGPAMTGELGDRRYLLVLQTPAESRATGGLVGGYVELRVHRGVVSTVRSGTNHDLVPGRTAVPVSGGFAQLWGRVGAQQQWYASNLSLDFPSVARVWSGLYEQQFGGRLDGVIAITPETVARLLRVTGPLQLSGGDNLSSDNVAGALEVSLYHRFPGEADEPARNAYQLGVLHELSAAVLRPLAAGRSYADALRGGPLAGAFLLASTHPDEQAQLAPTAIAHALPRDGRPFVAWTTQNAAGTKLDVYVHRKLSYQLKTTGGRQLARAVATLRNDAPPNGLPPYVTTRFDLHGAQRTAARAGTDKLAVATYLTVGARVTSVALDGRRVPFGSGFEQGHPVVIVTVLLQPAGGTATVEVNAEQPAITGPVTTLEQPVPLPDVTSLPEPERLNPRAS